MIITWLFIGAITGAIFNLFVSGKQFTTPATAIIVGCIGASVGGLINIAVTPVVFGEFSAGGLLCAVISAAILLFGLLEVQTA